MVELYLSINSYIYLELYFFHNNLIILLIQGLKDVPYIKRHKGKNRFK